MPYMPNLRGIDPNHPLVKLISDVMPYGKKFAYPELATEGARSYQGGRTPGTGGTEPKTEPFDWKAFEDAIHKELAKPLPGESGKSYGTQWDPVEAGNAQAYKGLSEAEWAKLDHSTQFKYITEAQDWQAGVAQPYPGGLLAKYKAEVGDSPQLKATKELMKEHPDIKFPDFHMFPPEVQQNFIDAGYKPTYQEFLGPEPGGYKQRQPLNIDEIVARHRAEVPPAPEVIRAYHGTDRGPVGYAEGNVPLPYAKQAAERSQRFQEPAAHKSERGVFFTPDPKTASDYAGNAYAAPGAKVFPVDIHAKNSVTIDMEKIAGKPLSYDPEMVRTAIDMARQNNKDFVIIKNMWDVGGKHDQIIAVRPSGKVRSAITGEALYGGLGGLLGAYGITRRPRSDESTISPSMAGR